MFLKKIVEKFREAMTFGQRLTSNVKWKIITDPSLKVDRRYYDNYADYLQHQAEKLKKSQMKIIENDNQYEKIVFSRYREITDFSKKCVICLGARLGGEVRAFKRLGALAIGIDIEPGAKNCHVLHGDFHNILFPDQCFDFAFTNAVDHVYDLEHFLSEVHRVLKNNGRFFVELGEVKMGNYEVLDTKNPETILAKFSEIFELEKKSLIENKTAYIDWNGKFLIYKKYE